MKTVYSTLLAGAIMIGLSACDGAGASTQNPQITLQGDKEITLKIGQMINDPGFSASDPQDGDITSWVKAKSDLNYYAVGTYYVNYEVTDSDGNKATASRIVHITEDGAQNGQYAGNTQYGEIGSIYYDMATYSYNALVLEQGKTIQQTVNNYSSNGAVMADTDVVFERNKENLIIYEYNNNTIESTDYIGFDRIQTVDSDQSSLIFNRLVRVNENIVNTSSDGVQLSCKIQEHLGSFNTASVTGNSVPAYNYIDVLHMGCDASNGAVMDTYLVNGWGEVLTVVTQNQVTTYSVLDKNSMQEVVGQ